MTTSILSHRWFGLAAGALVGGWAVPALGAECEADSDCPKGFTCEVSESVACPDVACPEGQSCEEAPECTVEEYRSCASIDCSADSDCADGMVCETVEHERCSTAGAPPPEPGTEPDPEADPIPPDAEGSCEVEERNYCMPRYLLPCEVSADCGPGFTCEASEVCSCSSPPSSDGSSTTGGDAGTPDGGGSDSGSGEDADAAERPAAPADGEDDGVDDGGDENCVCEAGPVACHLVITECAADSDCPSGMACEDNPEGTCTSRPDGAEECTADPEKICLPPYVDLVSGGAFDGAVQSGVDSDESGNPEEPPRGAPGEAHEDDDQVNTSEASGGGCSVAAAGAPVSAWAGFSLLLGAVLLGRRRRR